MAQPYETDESKWARLAEEGLTRKGKGKVVNTFKRLTTSSEGEKRNAMNVLRRDPKVPKSLINYVAEVGTMDAAHTALIILDDLLDPETKGRVRARYEKQYKKIKDNYAHITVKEKLKEKSVSPKEKRKAEMRKRQEERLMEKRGLGKKNEDVEIEDDVYSFAPETLRELNNIVGDAIHEANTNPEGVTEERLDNFSKALVSLNVGVNVDIFKEALKNVRESAVEFGAAQSACTELTDAARELSIIDPNDVNTLAAALARFMSMARERTKALETQLNMRNSQNDALSMEISVLNQKANKATSEATDLRTQLEAKTANLKELNTQMAGLTTKYNIAQESLKSAQQHISETDADFKLRIEKANEEALVLRQGYNALDVEKQQLSREIDNIRIELSEKNEEVNKLGSQLVAYEQTNRMLSQTDLQKANEIEGLKQTIGILNGNIEQIQSRLSFKENEYSAFKEIKEKEVQDLMEDLEKQKAKKVEYDALESKNAELEATIESFHVQKESLLRSIKEKDEAYAILRKQGLADAEKQKELTQDHINAKAVISDLENQIKELKTQIDLNTAKTAAFKAENEKLASRVVSAEKARDSAVQVNQTIKNEYNEVKKTLAASESKVKQLEQNLSIEAKNKLEAQKQCEMAKLQLEKSRQESLKLKESSDKASARILKLESNIKVLEDLKNESFIVVPPKEPILDNQGDIELEPADGLVQVATTLVNAQQLPDEIPLPMEVIKRILRRVSGPLKKPKDTSPLKHPPTLAGKKRSLNKAGGAYLVGGRPDPAFSSGEKFWKNAYNKGFKLF